MTRAIRQQQHVVGWILIVVAVATFLSNIADDAARLTSYREMVAPAFLFGVVVKHAASVVLAAFGGKCLTQFGGQR
jgi:uncharacterized membrane protein